MPYRLNVHKIDQSCLFELTWGNSQRLTASLAFPAHLLGLYEAWQRIYLGYYKQGLRGRAGATGQAVTSPVDWHSQLVQAEALLLSDFHQWLKHENLYELRVQLIHATQEAALGGQTEIGGLPKELFLTCTPLELARLPWETWEVGQQIQIVRSPANIRSATGDRQPFRRGKTRVLAILGDETGLNFDGERRALNAQKDRLDIHYVGWQPGENATDLKQRICQEIADPLGWDVLFFAGHSNELALLGGQIAIAPNTTMTIKELTPSLQQAQQRGLQFALFNSCRGLDIAQGLISLGLSQVAIMREPIHNEVAQAFLVQFLQRLAHYENAQAALLGACQFLKLEQNLTYPSAYLVPSLFRHPESVPYQIQPTGWRAIARRWQPTKREAIVVGALALLSLVPSLHYWLMDQRVWVQAVYRDLTHQVAVDATPPVVLVQIDQDTVTQWGTTDYKPLNRALLANIITRLNKLDAKVIGIDYLLDLAQVKNDVAINLALKDAIEQNQAWPVFITTQNPGGDWIQPYSKVINPDLILQGDAWFPHWHILPLESSEGYRKPFSYQLVMAHRLSQKARSGVVNTPQPRLNGQPLEARVQAYLKESNELDSSAWANLQPLTRFSYRFRQRWLQPLLDFSVPPEQVYTAISAWELLKSSEQSLPQLKTESLKDAIVVVAAGGYYAAGVANDGDDNLPPPPAMRYWYSQSGQGDSELTGGEVHAYMAHHFLTNRLVVPIPDVWMIVAAALVGKALVLYLIDRPKLNRGKFSAYLAVVTGGYGLLSLQLYISGAAMLPILLPSLTVWLCVVSQLQGESS